MASSASTIASQVPFHDFAVFCERVCKTAGKEKKKDVFRKFLQHWKTAHSKMHGKTKTTDSFFPCMRFMLPHFDRDRLSYGMKEVVLAKYYIDALNIAKGSEDAKRLLNYKAPTAKQDAGDFASVAYMVLKHRCPEKGSLTIEDINSSLDEIARANIDKRRDLSKKEIQRVIRNTSAIEQKWFIRIVLKEMKLGLNENSVFPVFHPEAKELYNVCNSLSKVCLDLHDLNTKLNETEIMLGTPFRPMLGQRAAIDDVEKLMQHKEFIIETKIDGERMQLHKNGDEYRYFSRGSIEYTQSFGATKYRGTLTPFIANCFKTDIKSCVLDGEMVGFDPRSNDYVLKGSNIDIKAENFGPFQPCFVVFDILMVNDERLANVPLKERIERAEHVFDVCSGRLHHVERKLGQTKEDVVSAINKAIDQREEGIVVKDPLSTYKPSKRNGSGWLKLKPEYVDSLSDDLDLIILGGNYGSGARHGGLISHFLLGVAATPANPGDQPTSFLTFGKVGSGYSDKELKSLLGKLHKHWRKFDSVNPPKCIQFSSGSKDKPEVWIEPKNSVIVQIKAAEISNSDKYKCGCTMRFPRLEKFRDDKMWYDCMTYDELVELKQIADGKLTYKLTNASAIEPAKKKRKVVAIEKPRTVARHFKAADIGDVKEISTLFSNMELCVVNGPSDQPKQELERKITEFGGTFVQNPGSTTLCVIAEKPNFRVKNMIARGDIDVVKADWLLQCFNEEQILPYTPDDMLYTTPKTLLKFKQDFDRYGDGYTEDTANETLARVFTSMKETRAGISVSEIGELEQRYFEDDSNVNIFRTCRLYVDDISEEAEADENRNFVALEFQFFGGGTCEDLNERTSHVLVDLRNTNRLAEIRDEIHNLPLKPHIVTSNWIRDCILKKRLLNAAPYEPA